MSTQAAASRADHRLRAAVVLVLSSLILAAVIVTASALRTGLLGVPTFYGNGVDSSLGARVAHDFLADQDAEAVALSNADSSGLGDRLTGNALQDVLHQISNGQAAGAVPTITFQVGSLTIFRAPDPLDPSLSLELQEDGTKTVVNSIGPNSAPTEQTISFRGDFWLVMSGGRYAIADQNIQNQPSSPLPPLAVAIAALTVVGIGLVLVFRQRRLGAAMTPVVSHRADVLIDAPAAVEPPRLLAEMEVRTFGGLHVIAGGKDWAQDLLSRPVTGFVWMRLLVGAVRDPSSPPARDQLARQVSPGLGRHVQLKRLRNVVAKGLRELPVPLRNRIQVEPEVMAFRLEGCDVDAVNLLRVSAECAGRGPLPATQASRAQRVLDASSGTFLPDYEKVEDLATDRHPTTRELVGNVRELLTSKRIDLTLVLADTYLAEGRWAPAIRILEPALGQRSDRKDLADRLIAAYRGAGRDAEARALAERYA